MGKRVFAIVVGSGFAGSLLSLILQRHGKDVVLIDRASHPRFAIGESSTPTGDLILRHLCERWNLPELKPLTSWGTWQAKYPQLRCGKKRGFSYYSHDVCQPFEDDPLHTRSLLVAASSDDDSSDTQWFRSDIDHFVCQHAVRHGVTYHDHCELQSADWQADRKSWQCDIASGLEPDGEQFQLQADWLIDASGNGNALAAWTGSTPDSAWMRTQTGAMFSHFDGVASFAQNFTTDSDADPFDGDDAAQHHLLQHGWMWMLRFAQGTTSVGIVQPNDRWNRQTWSELIADYPTLFALMKGARLCSTPGEVLFLRRLSRCRNRAAGRGWLSLPGAYGFVDPLHSTGIAHGLSGVSRIADRLLANTAGDDWLLGYDQDLRTEIHWIDTIVSGSYNALPSHRGFTAMAVFYFLSAITFEQDLIADPAHWPSGFLHARSRKLIETAERFWQQSQPGINDCTWESTVDSLRSAIAPWNHVGLLDPIHCNRFPRG